MKRFRFDLLDCVFFAALLFFVLSVGLFFFQPGFEVSQSRHGMWVDELISRFGALFSGGGGAAVSGTEGFFSNFFVWQVPFLGVGLPVMSGYYTGMAVLYYMLPFVLVFGSGVFAVKIGFTVAGFFTVLFVWYCTRNWFGKLAGTLCGVFCALCPVFARAVRLGVEKEEVFLVFLLWLALWLFCLGGNRRSKVLIYLGAFVFGVGLWSKFTFFAYLAGVGAGAVVFRGELCRFLRMSGFRARHVLIAFGFCFCGVLPFVVYNLQSGFTSVSGAVFALTHPDSTFGYVVDNRSVLHNLGVRAVQLWEMAGADLIRDHVDTVFNPVLALLFFISTAGCVFIAAAKRLRVERRKMLASFMFVYFFLFLCSAFTPSEHEPGHMVSFFPFFPVMAGVFGAYCLEVSKPSVKRLLILLFAVVAAMQAVSSTEYLYRVGRGQATQEHFARIYEFRDFLAENKIQPLVYLSTSSIWGNLEYGLSPDVNKSADNKKTQPRGFFLVVEQGDVREHVKSREYLKFLQADGALECSLMKSFASFDEKYRWDIWRVDVKQKVDESKLWFCLIGQEPEMHILFWGQTSQGDRDRVRLEEIIRGEAL